MLSKLRSAYAWVLFAAIFLPLFPVLWLLELVADRLDPRRDGLRRLTASWVSLYTRTSPLYHFHLDGREHLPQRGPYVLVANHESGLDLLCLLYLRTPARFLAEAGLLRIPLFGWLLRTCRHIPVKTDDRESGSRALEEAGASLAEGTPVAFFPEGGYSRDGLGEFRPGAFVAAVRAGVPVVPVLLEGTGRAWRPGTVVVEGTHAIRIAVLEPVLAAEVGALDPDALSARVRGALEAARTPAAVTTPGNGPARAG